MSSASFGLSVGSPPNSNLTSSSSAHQIRLSRRSSVSLGAPLLSTLERTMSVLRGDIVEKMKESVGYELEPALAAHNLHRRLSRGGSSSTSTSQQQQHSVMTSMGEVIDVGGSPIPLARRKHRKWRKPGRMKGSSSSSRNLTEDPLRDGDGGAGEGGDGDDNEEDEEEEVRRSQRGRRRAQSFMGEETENDWDDDDSVDEDQLRRRQERIESARRRAKATKKSGNAAAPQQMRNDGGGDDDVGSMADAAAAAAARDPALSTSSSLGSSSASMLTSTVQPQLLSLASSSAVPTRGQSPAFRSPLLEQHDQMLKQWQQANKIHRPLRRGEARPGGGNDDSDEDLEAGLPLLSRDKAAAAAAGAGGGVGGGKKGGGYGYGGVEVREDYDEAVMFLKDLCESLHLFGAPAHRIEYNMMRASDGLDIVAAYAVFPELCILSFGPQDDGGTIRKAETYLYRKNQGGLNCAKLRWCDDLATKVANQEIGVKEAAMELYIIRQLGPVYPLWVKLLMYGFASLAVCAVFFRGGWLEMLVSLVLGTGVGVVSLIGTRYGSVERMLEAIVSIAAAFLARLFVEYVYPACWGAISLSTIVWMLPGLSLTVGVNELAERKMISGTVRVFFAMLIALELGFGLAIGSLLVFWEDEAEFLEKAGDHLCDGTNGWVMLLFFFVICITFNGLQEALPNQWPMMTFTASLSYGLSFLGGLAGLRPQICTTVSAFATGIVGNAHARLTGHTATIPINAGILVLVPGSVGVRGVKALMENDIVSGIQFGFSMLTIALSIIVGLFVANMLFPLATKAAPKPASPDANNSTDLGVSQGPLDHISPPHELQRFSAK